MDEWLIMVVESGSKLPGCSLCEKVEKETHLFWGVHPTCLINIYYGWVVFARICFDSDGEILYVLACDLKGELEVPFDHLSFGGRFGEASNRIHGLFQVG
ncbi:hypothetical protein [Nocardiopsis sp. N85]|uniref:hypothetical protein n=1 Tax=Nocardiopsis sp. N85 TaxID=3029400 RepID=UPI00237EF331|nr:hypothetical protein [Nocardiopsis sp. N85]